MLVDPEERERVEFLLQILIGNSLAFVDREKFSDDATALPVFARFAVGAASAFNESSLVLGPEDVCQCCTAVLAEVLERPAAGLVAAVGAAFRERGEDADRLRQAGGHAMLEMQSAVTRLAIATRDTADGG